MASIQITGKKQLRGTVKPMPNKNSILPIITACVMSKKPITLHNVPKSSSVRVMLKIFRSLGGKVGYMGNGTIKLNASSINKSSIKENLAKRERASFMFLGALLTRFNKASIQDVGGCKLGNRPLDTMFQGLEALGVKIDSDKGYSLSTKGLKGNENIWLLEASVTGTENLIIAASKAIGKTIIYNAACEPHVQDLCNFLVSIGAKIKGIGTTRLEIEGVEEFTSGEWTIIPDHIDIGGLIVAACITDGEVLIKDAIPEHMTQIINYFNKFNAKIEIRNEDIFIPSGQKLVCKRNVKGNIDKVMDQPWPGFPVDLIPQAVILSLMSKGNMRILSVMYETQLLFVEELLKMKAELLLADSHQLVSFGPSNLQGKNIDAPSILQCAHAIVLAGLAAEGKTIIRNADIISRRYPNLVERLQNLGADIKKVR